MSGGTAGALVEQARVLHAEIERNTKEVIDIIAHSRPRTLKEEVAKNHAVRARLDTIAANSDSLNKYYADEELLRSKDLSTLGGGVAGEEDETALFSGFYDSLKHLRDLHRSGVVVLDQFDVSRKDTNTDFSLVEPRGFSGEEFYGRYLDLNSLHLRYMNLKRAAGKAGGKKRKRMHYLVYLKNFANFEDSSIVKDSAYVKYLKDLLSYLSDFHSRVFPLYPVDKIHKQLEREFNARKDTDHKLDLFCVACNKEFAKESVYNAHLLGKKHIKAAKELISSSNSDVLRAVPEDAIPLLEEKIIGFKELLRERVISSIQFVESMQTKTYEEILAERTFDDEEEEFVEEAGSDDDQVIYNPLKIPLG
jgi:splicing factor 3A subunit 3